MPHLDVMSYLLSREDCAIDAQDCDLKNCLLHACEKGSILGVEMLLKAGAKVWKWSKDGFTPLMAAAKNGNLAILGMLLPDNDGWIHSRQSSNKFTALIHATHEGHIEAVKLLVMEEQTNTEASSTNINHAFVKAAEDNHLEILKFFLKHPSVGIDAGGLDGHTALWHSAA